MASDVARDGMGVLMPLKNCKTQHHLLVWTTPRLECHFTSF